LPLYPTAPAVRIGRLAVHESFQGRGLVGAPLPDAARRTFVDAKNAQAVAFYQDYLFQPLVGRSRTLFFSHATAEKAFRDKPER
jgi:hypothetical protein